MATVFALEAGGFLIVTLPIDRKIARMMRIICAAWTFVFHRSLRRLSVLIVSTGCWFSIDTLTAGDWKCRDGWESSNVCRSNRHGTALRGRHG